MGKIEDKVKQLLKEEINEDLDLNKIGIEDDLFNNGIDSLNAIKLIVAIEQEFGFEFSDEELTAENIRTISSITHFIENKMVNQ